MAADDYVEWQPRKAPTWLQGPMGRAWWEIWGTLKDVLTDRAKAAIKARYPQLGAPDALEAIGHERQLERMPEEDEPTYVARLKNAHEGWHWGGTRKGVYDAIVLTKLLDPQDDGYYLSPDVVEAWRWPGGDGADATQIVATVDELRALTEHAWLSVAYVTDDELRWVYDPHELAPDDGLSFLQPDDVDEGDPGRWVQRSRWARFWVVIRPPHVFGPGWLCGEVADGGDGVLCGGGAICGYTDATVDQGALLSRQARAWKGGHNRGEAIIVVITGEICGGGWKCGEEVDGGDGIICGGEECRLPIS
jgi:hypothetical protein